ncbi:Tetracenomycin A2 monooxygenase-dioxygenase [Exophiala dermatitidis]
MAKSPDYEVPVLIVGGGIVGLSASLFLSTHFGIKSLLVERHAGTSIHPRARGLNRRTMELYRGIGIDEAVREAGASLSPSIGIYQGDSLVEVIEPIARSEQTESGPRRRMPGAEYLESLGPVEGCCGTQDMIEPVLLAAARERGGDLRFNVECVAFEPDDNGVTATLRDRSNNNAESTVRAAYMIAADGAGSPIRHQLGVSTTGAGTLGHLLNIERAIRGLFTSIDNHTRWVLHLSYDPKKGEQAQDFPPERCADLIRIALGIPDIDVKIKSILPWEPSVRVAERFQHGRIFLAGDAAHQMPPWSGQGANTGIADVHNLAWKLAAVLGGQATPSLLNTYDAERIPIARLVSDESGAGTDEHGLFLMWKSPPAMSSLFRRMPRLGGYGYSYDSTSQAIFPEDTTPLLSRVTHLVPSLGQMLGIDGKAGSRIPHIWVQSEGRRISILDVLESLFVVLAGTDGHKWHEDAPKVASDLGVDIAVYRVGPEPACELVASRGAWESAAGIPATGALLVRPDGFVAWRAWSSPSDLEHKLQDVLKRVLCQ